MLQGCEHQRGPLRILERLKLGLQGQAQVPRDGQQVLADGAPLEPLGLRHDLVAQVRHQAGKAGLGIELTVLEP